MLKCRTNIPFFQNPAGIITLTVPPLPHGRGSEELLRRAEARRQGRSPDPPLAEAARDVIFRFFFRRIFKYDIRLVEFDELAEQEESRIIGDAGRLLHVVSDD